MNARPSEKWRKLTVADSQHFTPEDLGIIAENLDLNVDNLNAMSNTDIYPSILTAYRHGPELSVIGLIMGKMHRYRGQLTGVCRLHLLKTFCGEGFEECEDDLQTGLIRLFQKEAREKHWKRLLTSIPMNHDATDRLIELHEDTGYRMKRYDAEHYLYEWNNPAVHSRLQ